MREAISSPLLIIEGTTNKTMDNFNTFVDLEQDFFRLCYNNVSCIVERIKVQRQTNW